MDFDNMEFSNIYNQVLKVLNLKPGDLVRVTHKVPSHYMGWMNSWTPNMDSFIGKIFEVEYSQDPSRLGISLRDGNVDFDFPPYCLEVVERGPKPIKVKISKEYTAEVFPGKKIVVGCQTIDKETFETIKKHFESKK